MTEDHAAAVRGDRIARFIYSIAWYLGMPVALTYLLFRSLRQPAYRRGMLQRFGLRFPAVSAKKLIWIHAVSVGETIACAPLVEALITTQPDARILLTHMTPTGMEAGENLFGDRVDRCLLPYDMPFAMRRFLRHFRPVLGVIMETELWPNMLALAQALEVPVVLVNARLSDRSLRKALRFPKLIQPALARFAGVLAQTRSDAERLAVLGCAATITGNLKFDVQPDPALHARGRAWRADSPTAVVLAASTRDGEEALLLQAWPDTTSRLLIVPRHPQRFDEVAALMGKRFQNRLVRRSAQEGDAMPVAFESCAALLGDSMGEMPAYYGLSDVAILGGSLLRFGGQNLIEACALGVPVVLGPHTFNFSEAAEQAVQAGAAVRVGSAAEAVDLALEIAADAPRRARMSDKAREFSLAHRGATQRTLSEIERLARTN